MGRRPSAGQTPRRTGSRGDPSGAFRTHARSTHRRYPAQRYGRRVLLLRHPRHVPAHRPAGHPVPTCPALAPGTRRGPTPSRNGSGRRHIDSIEGSYHNVVGAAYGPTVPTAEKHLPSEGKKTLYFAHEHGHPESASDYGEKRTGHRGNDPLQIIASPLCTLASAMRPWLFWSNTAGENDVESIVVGLPRHTYFVRGAGRGRRCHSGFHRPSRRGAAGGHSGGAVRRTLHLRRIAARDLAASGMPKSRRQEKGLLDRTSAALILRDYMESRHR